MKNYMIIIIIAIAEGKQTKCSSKLRKLRGNAFNPLLPKGFPIDE